MCIRKFINFSEKQFLSEKHLKRRFFMYYKIKKDKRNKKFVVTRQCFRGDQFRFEVQAKRVLQFDCALLIQRRKWFSLYLTSSTKPNHPTFIATKILQYRVFRNSAGRKNYILALKIRNFWIFIAPEYFWYFIDTEKIRIGRMKKLPKIFETDYNLPAYFKKGFEDTLVYVFHANEKDYLIDPKNFDVTGTAAQIEITEFTEITPLPPKSYFKAIDEKGEYLFCHSCSCGQYAKVEEFAEKDYPEEFKGFYGYWGKDINGNIVAFHMMDKNGNCEYSIRFDKPVQNVQFYSRTYTDTVNKYYYDIWQITYANGQKQLKTQTYFGVACPDIDIDQDAWNF